MSDKRKRRQPQREKSESPPDLYALRRLFRSDRKPVGGWVKLGKYARLKGTAGYV
jgi:hypothetical protein